MGNLYNFIFENTKLFAPIGICFGLMWQEKPKVQILMTMYLYITGLGIKLHMCAFPLNSRNLGIAKNLVVQDLI
jgi:hypothetical protein